MKIPIGSDHAGYFLKQYLIKELSGLGFEMEDCGTFSDQSVDYPDYAVAVCRKIKGGESALGILICSTGIGISIAANKFRGIRAALCHTEYSARMARLHNDANVLALGASVLGNGLALEIAKEFLSGEFSQGERHIKRIEKIEKIERER